MLEIYNYTELHKFLTDAWRTKKAKNAAFSLTAWAHQLGFESSSPLSLACKGKRAIPKKYLPQIIRTLDLDANQAQYLEALLDLSRAKTADQKLFYINRMKNLSPIEFNAQIVEEFKFLSEPIYGILLEMTELRTFHESPDWIQQRLQFPLSLNEISEALTCLLNLNLLCRDEKGHLKKSHRHLTTEQDIADLSSKHYHRSVSEMAGAAVFQQDVSKREFDSYAFNLKKDKMGKAKQKMRQFIKDFLTEFEAPPGEGNETYQLNLQLYQLTK